MAIKDIIKKGVWIPINIWNLNELFVTESISPISFYDDREFGNPVNRNLENVEDQNNLILFNDAVQSNVLLWLSPKLLDTLFLVQIKSNKDTKLKSFEYSKTLYLRRTFCKVYFNSQETLNDYLNNTFMLLEVKSVNKYKSDFIVDQTITKIPQKATYQAQTITTKKEIQPFFDKAFNQVKGLIYGCIIGSMGAFDDNEQGLISDLSRLKNTIAGVHTDIAVNEQYSNFWLINVRKQLNDCQKSYFKNFKVQSEILHTLLLRLTEVDNLNRMRCSELEKQNSIIYKEDFQVEQEKLEKAKREIYQYELSHDITSLRQELSKIKLREEKKGRSKGKTREYFKDGTPEYYRKKELKQLIIDLENNYEYQTLKKVIEYQEERIRNFEFGSTKYDTSIREQFSRISEYLHEIIKKTNNYFLSKNKQERGLPELSFKINTDKLSNFYFHSKYDRADFSIELPGTFTKNLSEPELKLLIVSLNSILSRPQGRLGNFSEQNILEIIKSIGENLPEGIDKTTLRDYHQYRVGKKVDFIFPENTVSANLLVFFMKLNGHEQINKMLVSKNVENKHFAFMFYGAYIGFANMPKTFTNIIFESNDNSLSDHIEKYLFENLINV